MCAMMLVSLSCLMTVVVLNLHFKGEYGAKVPRWIRVTILEVVGRLVGVTDPTCKITNVSRSSAKN